MRRTLLGTLLAALCTTCAPAPAASAPAPPAPAPSAEPAPTIVEPAPTIVEPEPGPAPSAASPDSPVTCTDRRTLRRADGSTDDCYPYVCRAGACLTRCAAMTDCAGAHNRAEFPAEGWPLECMPSGQCTPMPPDKVR